MESGEKGIVMDQFEPNSEWTVLDTSYKVEYEKDEAAVVFTIKLKRKPVYYYANYYACGPQYLCFYVTKRMWGKG
jgi:hypothetical protein